MDCTLGEYDHMWVTKPGSASAFGKLFSNEASVRSDVFGDAGHCIDHHKVGTSFHQRQLEFATRGFLPVPAERYSLTLSRQWNLVIDGDFC